MNDWTLCLTNWLSQLSELSDSMTEAEPAFAADTETLPDPDLADRLQDLLSEAIDGLEDASECLAELQKLLASRK